MGYRTVIPRSGAFKARVDNNNVLFSSLHRAHITDVNIEKGTVKISLEAIRYDAEITMPMLAMSYDKNSIVNNRVDATKFSWGRYIPQIGDIIVVGFGPTGELFAISSMPMNFGYFNVADQDQLNQEKGGTGWSKISRGELKPGDWDFKSSRNSTFYLGDRAKLASGVASFTATSNDQTANISAPLISQNFGPSYSRYGAAKRQILPTESETYIFAIPVVKYAQEYSIYANTSSAVPGVSNQLARLTLGDVVDDLTKQVKIPTINPAMPLRYYFSTFDSTYLMSAYEASIDALGNKSEDALLATNMKWNTPLAAWDVTNLSTSFLSTTEFSVTSPSIKLGGTPAISPLVKGDLFQSSMNSFLAEISAACIAVGLALTGDPTKDPALLKTCFGNISKSCLTLQASLSAMLSTISKTA